jgi:hypothetical protein
VLTNYVVPSHVHVVWFEFDGRSLEMSADVSQTCTGSFKAFCARFLITTTTTGILAMGTERKTRSGSQIPGIRNGFRYFLTTSQSAQNGENEG